MIFNTKIIDFILNDLNGDALCFRETPFHDMDTNLRKANLTYEYTQKEIENIVDVESDIIKFSKYCLKNVILRDYQKMYMQELYNNNKIICLQARQVGSTLSSSIFLLKLLMEGKKILIISSRRDSSMELISKIKTLYINLPFYMKPGIESLNQSSIRFDNGGTIRHSSNVIPIAHTFDCIFINGAAHIPQNTLSNIINSCVLINTKFILESSPNGNNYFYDIWTNANLEVGDLNKNPFKPIRLDYWLVPGRDEKWKQQTIKEIGSTAFEQEYELKFAVKTNKESEKVIIPSGDDRVNLLEHQIKILNDKICKFETIIVNLRNDNL